MAKHGENVRGQPSILQPAEAWPRTGADPNSSKVVEVNGMALMTKGPERPKAAGLQRATKY
jgi:hypothetical protein